MAVTTNHNPRAWLARQTDWRARANAAQANSFEALPFFIGAVVIAHQLGGAQTRIDVLAFVFVVLRLLYIAMYVADMATARSLLWTAARRGEHRDSVHLMVARLNARVRYIGLQLRSVQTRSGFVPMRFAPIAPRLKAHKNV